MADEKAPRTHVDQPQRPSSAAGSSRHHHHHHHGLHEIANDMDDRDAENRYREEAADNTVGMHIHVDSHDPRHLPSATDSQYNSDDEILLVAWEENDPENPYNWSTRKKAGVFFTAMLTIINSTMGSSLPSNAIPYMAEEWGVTSETQKVLPMSTFLVGYILGPLVWAPLSEQYGRRWLSLGAFVLFMIWTMACALAPNWVGFLVFRLLTGIFASAPMAVVSGTLADIFGEPKTRGRAFSAFMASTVFGPLFAPIISGYCSSTIGWRWTFWIGLIYAGVSFVPLLFLPETYGPVLLKQRAERLRREDPKAHIVAPHELEQQGWQQLVTVVLTRPLRMMVFEMIVSSVCAYLALVYAIFYMTFQAYPLIFGNIYGFSSGKQGLLFLAIGAGCALSPPIFIAYDMFLERAMARKEPWTRQEEYRRLPLACLGGPIFAISLFWLGWSARSEISFVVPMLAGIPFGLGYMLIFMALLNYLTDAYEIFAASANAAASCCRSLLATVLPLASTPMFRTLTISGACSMLGGLSLIMCVIPFLFIWQGERIRENSRFCIALQDGKIRMQQRIEAQRQRQQQQTRNQKPELGEETV